jgi:hypothetical protein
MEGVGGAATIGLASLEKFTVPETTGKGLPGYDLQGIYLDRTVRSMLI